MSSEARASGRRYPRALAPIAPFEPLRALGARREAPRALEDGDGVALSAAHLSGRLGDMLGRSASMREVFRLISRVARSHAPVMITGESGTGKELAARALHTLSPRAAGPFVATNCGAIQPTLIESELFGHEKGSFTGADRRRAGLFETAHGGTLFLDEVTEMAPELQVKLLRVLESGTFRRVGGNEELEVDVRLVSSSNRDLVAAVLAADLRSDLFYRLNVFPLRMPSLRERKEDLPNLASHFLSEIEEHEGRGFTGFEPGALAAFALHDWPGNVRELRNAVHNAYVLSDPPLVHTEAAHALVQLGRPPSAEPSAPPPPARGPEPETGQTVPVHVGERLDEVERRLFVATVDAVHGDRKAAARTLGVSLKTVYNRLRKYRLELAPSNG